MHTHLHVCRLHGHARTHYTLTHYTLVHLHTLSVCTLTRTHIDTLAHTHTHLRPCALTLACLHADTLTRAHADTR
jgi:hypothetical protein